MVEENKEKKVEDNTAHEEAKSEAKPKVEAREEIGHSQVPPPKQEDAKAEKAPLPKKEKPENCAVCNKFIKKKRWYYRNGKFYCTKRCWKTTVKKEGTSEPQKEAEAKGTAK